MNLVIDKEINEVEKVEKKGIIKKEEKKLKILIPILISLFIIMSIEWLYRNTGNLTVEQLIFHLKVPIQGTNTDMIFEYIKCIIPLSIFVSIITTKIIKVLNKKGKFLNIEKIIFMISIFYTFMRTDVIGYAINQINSSDFIQQNYASIEENTIIFPEEKNNLIYIYLESMESSYTSKENGGMYEEDYIEELRKIAEENIHFSNTEKLGGAVQVSGAGWTIAGMVAQTSGVPLKISIEQNSYDKYDTFLPGITTIGEILQQNGYKNYITLGSDASFGGRKNYFSQHGNYKIWDLNSAIDEGRMNKENTVWWGYDDNDLFEYAKEQLLEISKNEEPFNYTLLTADTHFVDGYVCTKCKNEYDNQYANVIACSSNQVSEFIKWIQEQDFYKNTTIIISGDHLTMQILNEEKEYERTIYNAIINPSSNLDIQNVEFTNRKFSTMDMFPTTLAALGVSIENNRLGLGTNLFSEEKTLIEIYGYDEINKELEKKSKFYDNVFIYNK